LYFYTKVVYFGVSKLPAEDETGLFERIFLEGAVANMKLYEN